MKLEIYREAGESILFREVSREQIQNRRIKYIKLGNEEVGFIGYKGNNFIIDGDSLKDTSEYTFRRRCYDD